MGEHAMPWEPCHRRWDLADVLGWLEFSVGSMPPVGQWRISGRLHLSCHAMPSRTERPFSHRAQANMTEQWGTNTLQGTSATDQLGGFF